MGFLGGFSWERNPGAGEAQGYLGNAMDQLQGYKTGNRFLKAFHKGDYSGFMQPFQTQAAAAHRLNESNVDPFLPPEIAQARTALQNARADELVGMQGEQFISNMLGHAMDLKAQQKQFKYGTMADLARAQADAALGSYQGRATQGWGSGLFGGLLGGLGAAASLGWSPFAKKPGGPMGNF